MTGAPRFSPAQLARMVGAQEPTAEQAEVIGAPLAPMAVIAGAGSGKSETMAARLVWLVANQLVSPDRVLGLTFTRKAAAELAERVRDRLTGLRRAGLVSHPFRRRGGKAEAIGRQRRHRAHHHRLCPGASCLLPSHFCHAKLAHESGLLCLMALHATEHVAKEIKSQ